MLSFLNTQFDPQADRPVLVRGEDGWRDAETGVRAVGARDKTLAEVAKPLILARAGEDPEAILLPLSEMEKDSRLNWALQAGTRLNGDEEPMFKVPWAVWQEHAAEPVEAWLPEHDAAGVRRAAAGVEREVRTAKRVWEEANESRAGMVLLVSRLGYSRRDVGEMFGLSAGRAQQLNENPPTAIIEEVEGFLADAAAIATLIDSGCTTRAALVRRGHLGGDRLDEVLGAMRALEMLVEVNGELELCDDGKRLLVVRKGNGDSSSRSRGKRERAPRAAR